MCLKKKGKGELIIKHTLFVEEVCDAVNDFRILADLSANGYFI